MKCSKNVLDSGLWAIFISSVMQIFYFTDILEKEQKKADEL